jgi:hypothetical protein
MEAILKGVAGDGDCFFQSLLRVLLETVSCYSVFLFPMQKQCYIVLSTITKPAHIPPDLILLIE